MTAGKKNTAEETKAHNLVLSQVSDKTKPFTQLKQPVHRKTATKGGTAKQKGQRSHLGYHKRDEEPRKERGGREGIKPSPTNSERVSEELSQARKFKLKVHRRSECRRHVSTAISTSAVCPRAHQHRHTHTHTHTHTPAASLTNNSKQLFFLTRFKQPRITQERAAQLWFHYSPG